MEQGEHALKLVIVEPEIPHNTGAIGRTCLALGAQLHLVRPLGFRLSDDWIRRSGLDYWAHVKPQLHDSLDAFLARIADEEPIHLFSTRGSRSMYETAFRPGSWLVFGAESRGLPEPLLERFSERTVRIPMTGTHVRSLNLANAASVALYEAWRQLH